MTQKWELVSLPRWEMTAYWILSFSSHLYSFYQLHKFSKGELPFWPRTKHKLPQVIREAVSPPRVFNCTFSIKENTDSNPKPK